ncbi:hypothetical protein KAM260_54440 (plasmid) [Klebsiella pneumoniae]|uniref:DUF1281 domain-containing protein n=1 Tax=Klebsiella TaxID=570 RepID=UPI0015D92D4C|nr:MULTISPECIES: DUF1281 domain-containing protein [Klebsiella]HAZ3451732.1 DUF1281 domain-containing protein [Raoultella ornithinolytica]HDT4783472.1 DUF1281 domain-containing protein [Klebsiella pneumoniae subsp. pneumoniae]HDU5540261.1 DUF1281 domain-containing protein [Klebsiella pneumoniae subsp. ozaenae]MDM6937122.1 DUF1281 domain-containing protein [Klebsiella michiganensis]MDM6952614.1 DUF1281 domain-containing protein [Klebsiella michiganensis]
MPNWCANRLTFSGIQQHADELKSWVRGEQSSLPGRAKREGIQLFLAGCAGLLRPDTVSTYLPCPALTAHGVARESTPVSQAFTRWLAMFTAGAELDTDTCRTLHQCWLDSGISRLRWNRLDEYAMAVIERLYRQKSCDWSDIFRPQDPESWWNRLCDGEDSPDCGAPMDFRLVLPPRLDIEVNGFNGGLLAEIPSSYSHYISQYGCKWPVGYDMNICFDGDTTLTVDFDTPWSPVSEDVVAALSVRYGAEIEHWYAEQGCDYCGYGHYSNGEITERLSDSLEWGEPDPEDDYPDVTGPDWIIDNIAHFGG